MANACASCVREWLKAHAEELDLDRIKALHKTLNQAMKREVEHLVSLGDVEQSVPPANPVMIEEEVL